MRVEPVFRLLRQAQIERPEIIVVEEEAKNSRTHNIARSDTVAHAAEQHNAHVVTGVERKRVVRAI